MHYLGGKDKIRKAVAAFLQPVVSASNGYWEPFCGGLSVISEIKHSIRRASDLHPVIHTYQQWGKFDIPNPITKELYQESRGWEDTNPLKHFIGFGCSFGGKYFGGYARDNGSRRYRDAAIRGLNRKMAGCGGVEFVHGGYDQLEIPDCWVIYCDPPYASTTGYATGKFEHKAFWAWAERASQKSIVLVSEYSAPEGWKCVWQTERNLEMQGPQTGSTRIEKVFMHGPLKADPSD